MELPGHSTGQNLSDDRGAMLLQIEDLHHESPSEERGGGDPRNRLIVRPFDRSEVLRCATRAHHHRDCASELLRRAIDRDLGSLERCESAGVGPQSQTAVQSFPGGAGVGDDHWLHVAPERGRHSADRDRAAGRGGPLLEGDPVGPVQREDERVPSLLDRRGQAG